MGYDFDWHARLSAGTESAARIVLSPLCTFLKIASAVDFGCGDGRWLRQCRELGVSTTVGIDGPWTREGDLVIPREDLRILDLETPIDLGRRFDLVISLEVAEHCVPECGELFVDNLVRHGDAILFSAAIPYQKGYRHVNERWQSYWASAFAARGYQCFDCFRSRLWGRDDVHFWYKQNLLLYINRDRDDLLRAVVEYMQREGIAPLPVDIVHPDKYLASATYDTIAFRPLMRKLPGKVAGKAAHVWQRLVRQ